MFSEHILQQIESLKTLSADELSTGIENSSGTFKVSEAIPALTELLRVFNDINPEAIELLPLAHKDELTGLLQPILSTIERLRKTELKPHQTIDTQKSQFVRFFNISNLRTPPEHCVVAKNLSRIWEIISMSNTNYATKLGSNTKVEDLQKELKSLVDSASKKNNELESKLNIRRTEFAHEASNEHIKQFFNDSVLFDNSANKWKNLLYWLIVGVGGFSLTIFILSIRLPCFNEHVIQFSIFSVVIISFLSYLIMFVVKNYNAAKHNATVLKHRVNCLSTFDKLREGESNETESIVLQYICRTIFPHQKTGYLSKEADGNNPNPLIESIDKIRDIKSPLN